MKIVYTVFALLAASTSVWVEPSMARSAATMRQLHFADHGFFGVSATAIAPGRREISFRRQCDERFVKGVAMPYRSERGPAFAVGALMSTSPAECPNPDPGIFEKHSIAVDSTFDHTLHARICETRCRICAEWLAGWPLEILGIRASGAHTLEVTYATMCQHVGFNRLVTPIPSGSHGPEGFAVALLEQQTFDEPCNQRRIGRTAVTLPQMVPLDNIYAIQPTRPEGPDGL